MHHWSGRSHESGRRIGSTLVQKQTKTDANEHSPNIVYCEAIGRTRRLWVHFRNNWRKKSKLWGRSLRRRINLSCCHRTTVWRQDHKNTQKHNNREGNWCNPIDQKEEPREFIHLSNYRKCRATQRVLFPTNSVKYVPSKNFLNNNQLKISVLKVCESRLIQIQNIPPKICRCSDISDFP